MAERQPAQRRANILDDIEDWMARRNADVHRLARDAEAAGRGVWERTTRTGENLAAMRPSDVRALGASLLKPDKPSPTRPGRVARPAKRPPTQASRRPTGSDAVDDAGRVAAGLAARPVGQVVGAFRGVRNMTRDLYDSAVFAGRLLFPLDPFISPPGEAAWNHVLGAGGRAVDYARDVVSNPRRLADDVTEAYRNARLDLDPSATPMADTIDGEWKRSYDIGKNQGELAFDLGSTLYGGAVLKELAGVGYLSKEAQVAKSLKQGLNPAQAAYLAESYVGRGHHFVPQRFKFPQRVGPVPLPKAIGGEKPPDWFMESPFNVLKPRNMSRGDFYELHYKSDPYFHYAHLPDYKRTGGWNGRELGLEKYQGLEQMWFGAPAPLKAAVGGVGVGAGGVAYDVFDGEDAR